MSEADNQAMQDPFKLGVLSALVVIGKALKADQAINTEALIGEAEATIAKLPTGTNPSDQQDQHTLALRWLIAGLR
ncbi:hypothetical protein [Pseudomonas fulva]|uniref:hypothetical protein n=1 Tax=Pseudomonas fulva TaxID=47880 RepID=UPI0018A979B8|nr:hypothetical protein [Pseudomonas fulva]MBF8679847.1 hypothetical protein [Pseudomonas fulva]MBF8717584.1 hypothetical protein [Pseudomonas fulva]MBF8784651.1 hypothetical protein [Pseudomonas fulva]MEB8055818.1 hypothetical protein [Pseudomonas fulva]